MTDISPWKTPKTTFHPGETTLSPGNPSRPGSPGKPSNPGAPCRVIAKCLLQTFTVDRFVINMQPMKQLITKKSMYAAGFEPGSKYFQSKILRRILFCGHHQYDYGWWCNKTRRRSIMTSQTKRGLTGIPMEPRSPFCPEPSLPGKPCKFQKHNKYMTSCLRHARVTLTSLPAIPRGPMGPIGPGGPRGPGSCKSQGRMLIGECW